MNNKTGVPRVSCEDSVAWGSYSPLMVARFQGKIGAKYTVECPDGCQKSQGAVYGCNPFMDESSICKAAMAAGVFNNKNLMTGYLEKGMQGNMIGSEVSFLLVAPEDHYDSCNLKGNVVSTKWLWQEWKKAKTPERIARDCSKE